MALRFQLSGEVTGVGRSLHLDIAPGAAMTATFEIDPNIDDEAAVTELIGTYPAAILSAEVNIGDRLRLMLSNPIANKISKRTADPYAYLLEAELESDEGPGHARGNFEVVLQRRTEFTPDDDTDDLAPPALRNYADRRWRIWLVHRGAPPGKIEGFLKA